MTDPIPTADLAPEKPQISLTDAVAAIERGRHSDMTSESLAQQVIDTIHSEIDALITAFEKRLAPASLPENAPADTTDEDTPADGETSPRRRGGKS